MSLNDYTILNKIGQGQFGIVFKAIRKSDNIPVAIKIISKKLDQKEEKMAKHEISLMKQINSPQIIKLEDHFKREEVFYMIMEYCSRGDLEKVLKGRKGLPEELVKLISVQIIKALVCLQQMKIAHRDIKLANIYINDKYETKLADLGLAKIMDDQLLKSYTGTPLNMAPEIFNNKKYTNKCDIWSFGVILYQMLFGNPPFLPQKKTLDNLINLVNTKPVTFPQSTEITLEAQDLIFKCLQKNPDKRISASQILKHPWIQSAKKSDKKLEDFLSKVMFQSGIIFVQQDDSQIDYLQRAKQQFQSCVNKSLLKFTKQFQTNVKKVSSNFSQCFKILKDSQEGKIALYSLLVSKIKQIQNIFLTINIPQNQIIISSQEYPKTKQAISYLKKLILEQFLEIQSYDNKLLQIIKSQLDTYYTAVKQIKQLLSISFAPQNIIFQYSDTINKQLIEQLSLSMKQKLNKTKIIEILSKPPQKFNPPLMDVLTTKFIKKQRQSQILYYFKCLEPLANLKLMVKSK